MLAACRSKSLFIVLSMLAYGGFLPLRAADDAWLQTARIFLIDAYQYPFAPELDFDAGRLAATLEAMHVNVVRMATMGKYATIQGVRFSTHPDQHGRDLLAETIAVCRPRGIRVVPYISTGHRLAWSMVTVDHPEYAQRTTPGGGPDRSHMFAGRTTGQSAGTRPTVRLFSTWSSTWCGITRSTEFILTPGKLSISIPSRGRATATVA